MVVMAGGKLLTRTMEESFTNMNPNQTPDPFENPLRRAEWFRERGLLLLKEAEERDIPIWEIACGFRELMSIAEKKSHDNRKQVKIT